MAASRSRAVRLRLMPIVPAACAALLLAGCAPGTARGSGSADPSAAGGVRAAPRAASDLQSDYERVIRNVLPSVVQIQGSKDLGSGVVYDDQGHVVTNAHVVGDQKTFKVTTAGSEQVLAADLVSSYPADDLAVIKLRKMPAGLRAASFGDTAGVAVGQIVLAMGSPLGLSSSVTQGIVSATGRTVSEGSSGGGTGATISDMVQTSAAINPGNSGGALVNLDGKVIGIPTLAATDPDLGGSAAPGIGFAIPASTVKTIAGQIVQHGKVTESGRAALGVTGRTVVGPDFAPTGVAVVSVKSGGAADKAGIRAGDIITKVGDQPVTTIASLTETLAGLKPGTKVQVTYVRGGSEHSTNATLGQL
ncbi:S1C family serine protease [Streptomyces sp. NPDC058045]|uniref:S1C family serine protease n=1 Tax=Streptomyces sp. NPDC058045 TaxID=3346311 RepID=UPI0036E52732